MHPAARLFCSVVAIAAFFALDPPADIIAGLGAFAATAALRSRSGSNRFTAFARLLLFGAVWLIVIHSVRLDPFRFDRAGLASAGTFLGRLGLVFALALWWSKGTTKEEGFAFLVGSKVPMPLVLMLLRALYAIPQLEMRSAEVLTNYHLRGFPVRSLRDRLTAAARTLPTVFASVATDLTESTAALISKGIFLEGKKTLLTELRWRWGDTLLCLVGVGVAVVAFLV